MTSSEPHVGTHLLLRPGLELTTTRNFNCMLRDTTSIIIANLQSTGPRDDGYRGVTADELTLLADLAVGGRATVAAGV